METRRLITGVMLAMALVLLWQPMMYWIGKKLGYDMDVATRPPATQPATTQEAAPAGAPATGQAAAEAATPGALAQAPLRVLPGEQALPAQIGSFTDSDPTYRMAVSISPAGAGVDSVILNQFKRAARGREPYVFQQPYPGNESTTRPLATRTVTLNGITVDVGAVQWSREAASSDSATYALTLADDSGRVLKLLKTYKLPPASDAGSGYEIIVTHSFQNPGDRPAAVRLSINGPTQPPMEQDRGGDRQVLAGFLDKKGFVEVDHRMIEAFAKDKATQQFEKDSDGNPMLWIGFGSIYFNAIVRPEPLDNAAGPPGYIQTVTASALNPDARGNEHLINIALATSELTVAPGQSLTVSSRVFLGPRQRRLLNNDYYGSFPLSYDQTLVLTSGPCAWCTFQWLINLLVWLLQGFHWLLFRDWGLAIIGLVVLVRVLLHPITKKSQVNMTKMSKLGPEIERLKKKHGDNKDELNKAMMAFYKQQGFTPVLGCLPMLLQMPIWIALWQALQTTFELRQAPFLHFFGIPLTWIFDLSKPDHLIELREPFWILGFIHVSGLNILPILLALVFWLQMKYQPKPAAMTKEQEQQQKMMMWMMPVLFPIMLYSGPSGLNLYILTSTAIGIVEAKIIRDHIKQREEEEKAARVIVDAKPTRAAKQRKDDLQPPPRPTGLRGWWANLQARAEQVRRETDKKAKG